MAVLLLLFLNQRGKDLEVFINKSCMKTSLFIRSAAQSDSCAYLLYKAMETVGAWEHASLLTASVWHGHKPEQTNSK